MNKKQLLDYLENDETTSHELPRTKHGGNLADDIFIINQIFPLINGRRVFNSNAFIHAGLTRQDLFGSMFNMMTAGHDIDVTSLVRQMNNYVDHVGNDKENKKPSNIGRGVDDKTGGFIIESIIMSLFQDKINAARAMVDSGIAEEKKKLAELDPSSVPTPDVPIPPVVPDATKQGGF